MRISGPEAKKIAHALCADFPLDPPARQVGRGHPSNPQTGQRLDDALWVYYVAPRSFTGEDVVEWMVHGSARIASSLVESAVHLGARQALPGEFSFRAVRNGKLTLEQAHAVADLIAARNDGAIALALDQLSGSQSRWVLDLADDLRRLATLSELGIDFSDQNVDEVALPTLQRQCRAMIKRLQALAGTLERGSRLKDGVSVTLLGEPNAGKSSLFNTLLGEDRSIVSEIPGTTRDVIQETLTLGMGLKQTTFRFADTAGLRETLDPIEKEGVSRSLRSAATADIPICVVDGASEGWKDAAGRLLAQVKKPTLLVFTKKDQLSENECAQRQSEAQRLWPTHLRIWVSSLFHDGIDGVIDGLIERAQPWVARETGELLLTRLDQKKAILLCVEDLERALNAPTEDLFAADVRQGLLHLAPLIGDTLPDDILGKIFSDFCIGK